MARKKHRSTAALPLKFAQLGLASMEVIARRTMLMASGKCSPAEYRRMVREKMAAAAATGMKLMTTGGRASTASLISPWHSKATANVKRLRRR